MKSTFCFVPTSALCVALAATFLVSETQAADEREWMSRRGGTVIASLSSVAGDEAVLVTPEAREIRVKVSDLSLADRQHLIEFGGADASIITEGDPGTPEKDVRLDSSTMNRRAEKLSLGEGSQGTYDVFETPRFWIATAGGVRPNALAETAERLWHGMAFQHMNFRKDWGDKKMLIIAVEDRTAYEALGKWVMAEAGKRNPEAPARIGATWQRVGATQINLPDELVQEHNLLPRAQVFNVTDSSRFRRPMGPFQINCISGFLLTHQMGGVSSFGSEGYFAVTTGHSYYKEILLGGKSETNQLAVQGTGNDEISSKSGFEDGRSWARTLRTMVRRGDLNLDLQETLSWSIEDLDPAKLVTIYAFGYYMQSDSQRLSSYSRMIRRIESSNQIPEPIEIARLFGHETVEAFNEDWKQFVVSGNFR
jgi:hypothetical protein